jgi:cysteinyl-tRNA synthetase
MSMKYLGDSYDIHTAGRELMFPHHENEIAIAKAVTGRPLAKYWLHCDRVLADGKIIGDQTAQLSLDDLAAMGCSGKEIRFWLLATHYRKPVVFSETRLADAQNSLKRLNTCIYNLMQVQEGQPCPELDQLLYDLKQGFVSAMDDDLNIAAAMASQFKTIKQINVLIQERRIDPAGAARIVEAFRNIDKILNVYDFFEAAPDAKIQALINRRAQARKTGDWATADRLRAELQKCGVVVRDNKLAKG